MKIASFNRFAILFAITFALATPAFAASDDDAAPADQAAATTDTAPDTAAAPAAKKPAAPEPGSTVVGDETISHTKAETNKTAIDVFFTIKNAGKSDDRITGAGSTWDIGDVVQVKKDKDGKETESPVAIDVPAGKSVELSESTQWLRIKSITTKPKDMSTLPFTLYFRHSPNAPLQIAMGKGGDSGKSDSKSKGSWFGK